MLFQDKRGISVIIGYILLVTIAIVMGVIVYSWMKSYVPSEDIKCPDGVSLVIEKSKCLSGVLNLTIKNSGRFSVAGYFIYGTNSTTQELATKNLSGYIMDPNKQFNVNNAILLTTVLEENPFAPSTTKEHLFNLASTNGIYSIEIIPIRYYTVGGKKRLATCDDARLRQDISKCPA